jgi:hypothetical protein
MKPFKLNNKNNFLAGWYIDEKVCDQMINYFEKTNETSAGKKEKGTIGKYSGDLEIDLQSKDSLDLPIFASTDAPKEVKSYLMELSKVLNKYLKKYIWATDNHAAFRITESFNIQKYPKGGGFKVFHFERNGTEHFRDRHLVFMTYLNDVKEGGETEFLYQKIKVKPEKGLTVIWPSDWTFTHRGIPAKKEIKYIATGWYDYV